MMSAFLKCIQTSTCVSMPARTWVFAHEFITTSTHPVYVRNVLTHNMSLYTWACYISVCIHGRVHLQESDSCWASCIIICQQTVRGRGLHPDTADVCWAQQLPWSRIPRSVWETEMWMQRQKMQRRWMQTCRRIYGCNAEQWHSCPSLSLTQTFNYRTKSLTLSGKMPRLILQHPRIHDPRDQSTDFSYYQMFYPNKKCPQSIPHGKALRTRRG